MPSALLSNRRLGATASYATRSPASDAPNRLGTGGEIASGLSRLCGDVLAAGWVSDNLANLCSALGVELSQPDADSPSEEVAARLATRAREMARAECSLVTLAPNGLSERVNDETVVAIATGGETRTSRFPFAAHPDIRQTLAAKRGLNELRLLLSRSARLTAQV